MQKFKDSYTHTHVHMHQESITHAVQKNNVMVWSLYAVTMVTE